MGPARLACKALHGAVGCKICNLVLQHPGTVAELAALHGLLKAVGPQLKSVHLRRWRGKEESLEAVLEALGTHCPGIEALEVEDADLMTPGTLSALARLVAQPGMTDLTLNGNLCNEELFDSGGLMDAFIKVDLTRLRCLRIKGRHSDFMIDLLPLVHGLEVLEMPSTGWYVDDEFVMDSVKELPLLRELTLLPWVYWNPEKVEHHLRDLGAKPTLRKLKIEYELHEYNGECWDELSRLQHLHALDVKVTYIGDRYLHRGGHVEALASLARLESLALHVTASDVIKAVFAERLAVALRGMTALAHLDIRGCKLRLEDFAKIVPEVLRMASERPFRLQMDDALLATGRAKEVLQPLHDCKNLNMEQH